MSHPEEILLTLGGRQVLVASQGAALRGYSVQPPSGERRNIVWGYSGTPNKKGGQGDVLMPFPGRVRGGAYEFEGRKLQMKRNDKDGPNAIHGFVRSLPWEVVARDQATATFRIRLEAREFEPSGYPFSIEASVTYALSETGLRCDFSIRNTGQGHAPVGAGFHPYFEVGTDSVDEVEALIPAGELIEFASDLLPTGERVPVRGTALDFREWRCVGDTRFNHCYSALEPGRDGITRAGMRNPATGDTVTVWMDASFPYLVVYTGDTIPAPYARKALALEPMTCATDAFNRPEWGLRILSPGEVFHGSWGVVETFSKQ